MTVQKKTRKLNSMQYYILRKLLYLEIRFTRFRSNTCNSFVKWGN